MEAFFFYFFFADPPQQQQVSSSFLIGLVPCHMIFQLVWR